MPVENKEIAEFVKAMFAAYNSKNAEVIAKYEFGGAGFGMRSKTWRGAGVWGGKDPEAYADLTKRLLDYFEYDNMDLEELNTTADGDVGLAWGFYLEKFKLKGQPPEQARVRFSSVFKKEADGWRHYAYHRDIQPFGPDGKYLTEFTRVKTEG